MQTLLDKAMLDIDDYISWAAYHASQQSPLNTPNSIVALLPLFREKANTVSMVSHAMKMIIEAVDHLNPGQVPVIVADQPLYALAKKVQWRWPKTLGEGKCVLVMGGLHVEMNCLKLLGDWLQGCGWTAALIKAEITTPGRANAMLSGSHVTRTRYAHQVTVASLYILQQHAYACYLEQMGAKDQNPLSFDEWCIQQSDDQPMFKFWATTMRLELILLQFVRSIRERNFELYVQVLLQMAPWMFVLDHTNYSRWLPVHLHDMANLATDHPDIHREFIDGHFAVQKSTHVFSAMAIDQCHEQVNELIKGDGGAVGLTENQQALERWMVAGPEIARVVVEFEESNHTSNRQQSNKHHEQFPWSAESNLLKMCHL